MMLIYKLACWKDGQKHGARLLNGLGVDLFHPQLGDDVVLWRLLSVESVVVSLWVGLRDAPTTARRRQEAVSVMSDWRHARQAADSLPTWTEQASDVVEVLVMMPYDNNVHDHDTDDQSGNDDKGKHRFVVRTSPLRRSGVDHTV